MTKYLLMENIFIRNGRGNILVIAPHGHPLDDTNSDILAQSIASYLNCDAVINTGWRRDINIKVESGLANLNDVNHCKKDPILSEFLEPIQDIIANKSALYGKVFIFLIHGMDDNIRNEIPNIDVIVGYGNGNPPKYTCKIDYKNNFISAMNKNGLMTKESKIGGKFGAYNDNNLTQFLKSPTTECLQIEIVGQLRKNSDIAIQTGKKIGETIEEIFI